MDNARRAELPETEGEATAGAARSPDRRALLRWLPLILVALVLIALYASGLTGYLSLDTLRRYQDTLVGAVSDNPLFAAAIYAIVYVVVVAVSFPGAGALTITGGFLFGPLLGTVLASIAATIGATLIFLIARTSLGDLFAKRAGPRMLRLRRGFHEEGFGYLLFLRLVPIFPFWLVNLAAALFGMRLLPYVAATAIGVVPATFVFAYFGHSLETVLGSGRPRVPAGLFVALALLGVLALAPIVVRRWRRGRDKE